MTDVVAPVKPKWYHKTSMLIVAFLCVGPLAVPLVWLHPKYNLGQKILGTVLMIGATVLMWIWLKDSYDRVMVQYKDLQSMMGASTP